MAIPAKQIGWSQKANLLWQISKQLEILTQVAGNSIAPTSTTTTTVPPTTTTTTSSSSTTTTSTSTSTSTTTTTTTVSPTTTTTTTTAIPTVTIGTQVWMGENLDVTTYQNGDPIPEVTDPAAWAALTTGAWCYLNNDPAYGPIYGKLYNWYAVNDPRGLGPVGYHVPTLTEYTTLGDYLGGQAVAGGALKEAGFTHWDSPNTGATNSSGWTGLPGYLRLSDGTFGALVLNTFGYWWTSSENSPGNSNYVWLYTQYSTFYYTSPTYYLNPKYGFSVRCLQN
jgi:uncharacterized protein (TIGR02145 family)